jgi:hypothetical protein
MPHPVQAARQSIYNDRDHRRGRFTPRSVPGSCPRCARTSAVGACCDCVQTADDTIRVLCETTGADCRRDALRDGGGYLERDRTYSLSLRRVLKAHAPRPLRALRSAHVS